MSTKAFNHLQDKYGGYSIERIRVVKTQSGLLTNLKSFSKNKIDDPIHHAGLQLKLRNRFNGDIKILNLEKLEVPKLTEVTSGGDFLSGSTGFEVLLEGDKQGMSLNRFINNTRRFQHSPYGKYSLKCSNCQRFVINHLTANGIEVDRDELNKLDQKAENLVPDYAEKPLNFITDRYRDISNFIDRRSDPSKGNPILRSDYASLVGPDYGRDV